MGEPVPHIRPMVEEDLPTIVKTIGEGEAKTSLPKPLHDSLDLRSFLEDRLWVVEISREIVGYILLWRLCEEDRSTKIIAAFNPVVSLDGAVAAFQRLVDVLFQKGQFQKISFMVHPDHHFFFSVARKLSFFLEGTLRKHLLVREQRYDVALFSQLLNERRVEGHSGCCLESLRKQSAFDNVSLVVVRAVLLRSVDNDIEVLLLKKSETLPFPGLEEPPGGKIYKHEGFSHALKRIVKKETGISITDEVHFLTSFDFSTEKGQRVREYVFRVMPTSLEITIDPKTHESYHWIRLQELPSTPLHPDLIQVLSTCSPSVSYESQSPTFEHEATLECVHPPTPQLEEALLSGIHLDAYAAKGYAMIEPVGVVLRDSSLRIVGGIIADIEYGALIIQRIWINQEWQRTGWGKRLLARVEQLAREKGVLFISAHAMDWEDLTLFQQSDYYIESQQTGFADSSRCYFFRKELDP